MSRIELLFTIQSGQPDAMLGSTNWNTSTADRCMIVCAPVCYSTVFSGKTVLVYKDCYWCASVHMSGSLIPGFLPVFKNFFIITTIHGRSPKG